MALGPPKNHILVYIMLIKVIAKVHKSKGWVEFNLMSSERLLVIDLYKVGLIHNIPIRVYYKFIVNF